MSFRSFLSSSLEEKEEDKEEDENDELGKHKINFHARGWCGLDVDGIRINRSRS